MKTSDRARPRAPRARRAPVQARALGDTTAEERRAILERMHAEWMMATFIDSCREAETNGTPWLRANVHDGVHLPLPEHRLDYLREKLECIYGTKFQVAAR